MNREELWRRVKALQGKSVPATSGTRAFDVVNVSDDAIVVRHIRARHSLPRAALEAAYALGHTSNALSPAEFHAARIADYDPICLVGILNAIGADRE